MKEGLPKGQFSHNEGLHCLVTPREVFPLCTGVEKQICLSAGSGSTLSAMCGQLCLGCLDALVFFLGVFSPKKDGHVWNLETTPRSQKL